MILVDTSVWIDHLHERDAVLVEKLHASSVTQHPMVVGELALGSIKDRPVFLGLLQSLPRLNPATHDEVLHLVEARRLFGRGLSLVDAHLLAAALLNPGTFVWTRDKRLRRAALQLGVASSYD